MWITPKPNIKWKSKSQKNVLCLAARSCPTLLISWTEAHLDPLSKGILQAKILEWVAMPSSRGIFPTQGSNLGLQHCRQIPYHLSHQGSPQILEWVPYPFSRGTFPTQESNQGLQYCRRILYQLSPQGSPLDSCEPIKNTFLLVVSFCRWVTWGPGLEVWWRPGTDAVSPDWQFSVHFSVRRPLWLLKK